MNAIVRDKCSNSLEMNECQNAAENGTAEWNSCKNSIRISKRSIQHKEISWRQQQLDYFGRMRFLVLRQYSDWVLVLTIKTVHIAHDFMQANSEQK